MIKIKVSDMMSALENFERVSMKDFIGFIKSFNLHTIIIIGVACLWLNSSMEARLDNIKLEVNNLKEDIKIIKTVLAFNLNL